MSQCPITPDKRVFASLGLFSYNFTLKQRPERCCHCHYKLYLLIIHKSKRKRESEGSRSTPFSPGTAGALRAMLSGVMGRSPQPQPRSHRDPGEPWPSELSTVTGVIAQTTTSPLLWRMTAESLHPEASNQEALENSASDKSSNVLQLKSFPSIF